MPRRTVKVEEPPQRIEPMTTPGAWRFYDKHVIDPAMDELRAGMPLTHVLVLTYYLGLWHAMQMADETQGSET